MMVEIALVLCILIVSVVLLVTEWIPMEVTALLALGAVALSGLVSPVEALSGFSNPAVVTVWAVFILSGGLTRTGVANVIGNFVLRLAGRRETTMIVVIMATAGILSAVMNNVAVAALMLPVVMDIARHTATPPSRLLMPLAYGSLLGGLTTQIGTPPNILVSDALREAGLKSFTFFDFTPVGGIVMAAGIAFMVLVGRHMLPDRDVARDSAQRRQDDWKAQYDLQERAFSVDVPVGWALSGRTLAQIRMGSILGWNVIAITRAERTIVAPGPADTLNAGDRLVVEGRVESLNDLQRWRTLASEPLDVDFLDRYSDNALIGEVSLTDGSRFAGATLNSLGFRSRFGCVVLAIRRQGHIRRAPLADGVLRRGDVLLVSGPADRLQALAETDGFERFRVIGRSELARRYALQERLMVMKVPLDSPITGKTLAQSRLGDALSIRVLGILRDQGAFVTPEPGEVLRPGDRLVVEGRRSDFEALQALQQLEIDRGGTPDMGRLAAGDVGLVEAVLSPRTTLEGKSLRQINFREKFGVNVLALWRKGRAYRSDLRDMDLRFGDALLLLGQRGKLQMLGGEPDFIVLTEAAREAPRIERMKHSLLIMAAVLVPVVLGWVPIYIAAVVGAALMVMTGCLSMEEAYRQIEWKAVFLIAGMLPLGTALDKTGAARLIADGVVALAGPYGPTAVMAGLVALTFAATCFVPTAALVVLMAPIVLSTSADMGLAPNGLLMAVAMAASASFTTPIAHPANILVMGPGGYRFSDYLKVGGMLTVVVFAVLMLVMPVFWPLAP